MPSKVMENGFVSPKIEKKLNFSFFVRSMEAHNLLSRLS